MKTHKRMQWIPDWSHPLHRVVASNALRDFPGFFRRIITENTPTLET